MNIKNLLLVVSLFLVICIPAISQTPQKFKYQGICRDNLGVVLPNQAVNVRLSIHDLTATGAIAYQEMFSVITNQFGLITLDIGDGVVQQGVFLTVPWQTGDKFLEVEMDLGSGYISMGTTQLLSVPYALHSKTAESISGTITEIDPVFVASPANGIVNTDITNWNTVYGWGNHSTAGYLISEVDGSVTNEIQLLSISNDTIRLSNGGFVKLPAGFNGQYSSLTGAPTNVSAFTNDTGYLTSFTEIDGSVTNELQALSISNDTIRLSNGGFVKLPAGFNGQYSSLTGAPTNVSAFTNDAGYLTSFTEVDGSVTNELQVLSISNDTIRLSNGGFVKLPAGFNGQYSSLTGAPTNVSSFANDAGYLTSFTEVDGSVTNELQALSISNDTIYLSNGGFVKLPAGFNGQYSSLTGAPTNVSAFTNDAGYLTSFTETDPKIEANTSGYSPKWNGSAMVTGAIYQDASNNVGIGTTTPSTKLEVSGQVKITGGTPGAGKILTSDAGGLASWQAAPGDNLGNHTATQNINLNGFALVSGGTRGLKMDSRGNIGINMAPQNTSGNDVNLDILSPDGWGHANVNLRGYNWATNSYKCTRGSGCDFYSGAWWSDTYNEHLFFLCSDGAEFAKGITIRKNSNVGIGTQAPSTKLDVNGVITATGGNSTNWNTAYGWGNHASAGYLTSFTESDTMLWKKNISDIYFNTGNVGIGTNAPSNKLSVLGSGNFTTSVKSPLFLPLDGIGNSLTMQTTDGATSTGSITIRSGDVSANGPTGGTLTLRGGNYTGGYKGAQLILQGYPGSNGGGSATLTGGDGWSDTGGDISLQAGNKGWGNGGSVYISGGNGGAGAGGAGHIVLNTGNDASAGPGLILMRINGTEALRINSARNVGIGLTNPTALLHIKGGNVGQPGKIKVEDFDPSGLSSMELINNSGEIFYFYKLSSGYPANGRYTQGVSMIESNSLNGLAISEVTGDIHFYTAGNNERLTIKNSGDIGIGNTNPGAKLDVNGDLKVSGSIYSPGMVVQTIVKTSELPSSLNVTTYTEANADYRVSFTPKFNNSIILVEYNFPINTAMASNTVFDMQLIRDIGGTEVPVGVGPVNGSRQQVSFVGRPGNGTDGNDRMTVSMTAKDSGLTSGTLYTYGFKYRRETGGSGTCYFNSSNLDSNVFGFSGIMTMKITEIAQ